MDNTKDRKEIQEGLHLEAEIERLDQDQEAIERKIEACTTSAGKRRLHGEPGAMKAAARELADLQAERELLGAARPSLIAALREKHAAIIEAADNLRLENEGIKAREISLIQGEFRKEFETIHKLVSRMQAITVIPGSPTQADPASDGPGPFAQPRIRIAGLSLLQDEIKSDVSEEARLLKQYGETIEAARAASALVGRLQDLISTKYRQEQQQEPARDPSPDDSGVFPGYYVRRPTGGTS